MQLKAHRLDELELFFTLLSFLLAWFAPGISQKPYRFMMRKLRRLAGRPVRSALVVAALPLVLRFALLPWIPIPQPQIQEEFSYLLGADTFAHGRLANPAHPMAAFFDNFQLIQTPTYASARPPGHAAFLALGEVLFHQPWLGVCLSIALMCAAFYWMLLAWARPPWALLVAILFAMRFGVFSYWMNSYWGGSVIALGGALVLGAVPRLLKSPQLNDALLYGVGCCLLASTRPYEGLVYVLPTVVVLLAWLLQSPDRSTLRSRLIRTFLPMATVLGLFLAWFAYYNLTTTGSATQMAYTLWRKQQGIVPGFWWQPLGKAPPGYLSPQTRAFNAVWEVSIYRNEHRNLWVALSTMAWRLIHFLQLYLRPLLLVAFLAPVLQREPKLGHAGKTTFWNGLFVLLALVTTLVGHSLALTTIFLAWGTYLLLQRHSDPKLKLPIVLLLTGALCAVLTNFSMPTYYAHFVAPAEVLIAAGLRSLATWRGRERVGKALVLNLSLANCLMFLVSAAIAIGHVHVIHESPFNWSSYENAMEARIRIQSFLEKQPGQQLAVVRYSAQHNVLEEWVWNLADIDGQKVVWARELQSAQNAELMRYYSGRKVWLVEPDSDSIQPYPAFNRPGTD